MSKLIEEIALLKAEILKLNAIVKSQNETIKEYQENYLINMFNSLGAICDEYGSLLNPTPIVLNASYKGKSEKYEINIENVICAGSIGRTKLILLKKPIIGFGNNVRKTDVIHCNYGLDELIKLFNPVNINFFKVNKSVLVNLKYYESDGKILRSSKVLPNGYDKYSILKIYDELKLSHFVNRKENYNRIYSLHKILLRYKLQNGIPL